MTKGFCSANLVFNTYDARLAVATPSGPVTRSVNYVFTGLPLDDHASTVVGDLAHPELPNTDMVRTAPVTTAASFASQRPDR